MWSEWVDNITRHAGKYIQWRLVICVLSAARLPVTERFFYCTKHRYKEAEKKLLALLGNEFFTVLWKVQTSHFIKMFPFKIQADKILRKRIGLATKYGSYYSKRRWWVGGCFGYLRLHSGISVCVTRNKTLHVNTVFRHLLFENINSLLIFVRNEYWWSETFCNS